MAGDEPPLGARRLALEPPVASEMTRSCGPQRRGPTPPRRGPRRRGRPRRRPATARRRAGGRTRSSAGPARLQAEEQRLAEASRPSPAQRSSRASQPDEPAGSGRSSRVRSRGSSDRPSRGQKTRPGRGHGERLRAAFALRRTCRSTSAAVRSMRGAATPARASGATRSSRCRRPAAGGPPTARARRRGPIPRRSSAAEVAGVGVGESARMLAAIAGGPRRGSAR